jgi:hypothetical protein
MPFWLVLPKWKDEQKREKVEMGGDECRPKYGCNGCGKGAMVTKIGGGILVCL